ncbi:MAG: hypothetical protein LBI26_03905, partial [Holosporales bacterium]|nr:hypothetical protein [Holosporales bacterium]
NLKGTETISGKPGQWKMNANQSNFLTKLRTITLRPAEGMTLPTTFTVIGAQNSSGTTINITFHKTSPSSGVYWNSVSGMYTWTRP